MVRSKSDKRSRFTGEYALTAAELGRLLEAVDRLDDLALLQLAAVTGIRREDVVAVPLEGLNLARGDLTFYESKKGRTRTVPIDPGVVVTLRRYVRTLPRRSKFLFPARHEDAPHLSGRSAHRIFNRWLLVAGLAPRPFHALRGTAYKLARARGWTVEQGAALIGDSVGVAMLYYGATTVGELSELVRARPLLGAPA